MGRSQEAAVRLPRVCSGFAFEWVTGEVSDCFREWPRVRSRSQLFECSLVFEGGLASIFRKSNGEPVSARVRFSCGEGEALFFGESGREDFREVFLCLRSCETSRFRKTVEWDD